MSIHTVVQLRPPARLEPARLQPARLQPTRLQPGRSTTPLVPPTTVPRASSPLSAAQLARLVAWRQLHAQWPVHLLMALVVAGTWLSPDRFLPGSALFALVGIGAYAAALGLGPSARQELFWHGLGGAPGVREGARLLLHVSLVAGALLAVRGAELDNLLWTGLASLCALSLLGFARSWASSQAGRLLVVAGALILSLATLAPSLWIAKWSLVMGGELRLGALVVSALVARLLLARRRPASAAGRKRRAWAWVALPLATGLVSVVEVGWPTPVSSQTASFGRLMVPSGDDPLGTGQRIWRVDTDGYTALPLRGPLRRALLHDSGAVSYMRPRRSDDTRLAGLMAPDGATIECAVAAHPDAVWISAEGRGAVELLTDGSGVTLDVDGGCGKTSTFPDGLPLTYELDNRQRIATGRRLFEQGPRPGTILVHRSDGTDRIWDLLAGGPE